MTDAARNLSENLAKAVGGLYLTARYWDLQHPEPPDTRTEEEKFYGIIDSLGFKVVG